MLIYKIFGVALISLSILSLIFGIVIFISPGLLSQLLRKKVVVSQRNILLGSTLLFTISLPLGAACAVIYRNPATPLIYVFLTFFFLLLAILSFIFGFFSLLFPQFLSWLLRKDSQLSRWKILIGMVLGSLACFLFTGIFAFLGKNSYI